MENILNAKDYIYSKTDYRPKISLILGSGLNGLADEIENAVVIPYQDIPHFAATTVDMHKGQLVIGELLGKEVAVLQGRFHYYEGHSLDAVTFPVRVLKEIGAEVLIVTNACGAINESFEPKDLMLISDHINLAGVNPLIGSNDEQLGVRFPDLSTAYCPELRDLACKAAEEKNIELQQGVYVWWSGPALETPAEIRMMRTVGGDAVGMSTVPEVIVANHAGLRVLGISCIANMAAGIQKEPITAEEVVQAVGEAKDKFLTLLKGIIQEL